MARGGLEPLLAAPPFLRALLATLDTNDGGLAQPLALEMLAKALVFCPASYEKTICALLQLDCPSDVFLQGRGRSSSGSGEVGRRSSSGGGGSSPTAVPRPVLALVSLLQADGPGQLDADTTAYVCVLLQHAVRLGSAAPRRSLQAALCRRLVEALIDAGLLQVRRAVFLESWGRGAGGWGCDL
jgi:hypothetical protein